MTTLSNGFVYITKIVIDASGEMIRTGISYRASRERRFHHPLAHGLKTSQADGDSKNVRISIDALAKARGIPANYPPR